MRGGSAASELESTVKAARKRVSLAVEAFKMLFVPVLCSKMH